MESGFRPWGMADAQLEADRARRFTAGARSAAPAAASKRKGGVGCEVAPSSAQPQSHSRPRGARRVPRLTRRERSSVGLPVNSAATGVQPMRLEDMIEDVQPVEWTDDEGVE